MKLAIVVPDGIENCSYVSLWLDSQKDIQNIAIGLLHQNRFSSSRVEELAACAVLYSPNKRAALGEPSESDLWLHLYPADTFGGYPKVVLTTKPDDEDENTLFRGTLPDFVVFSTTHWEDEE